MPVRVVIDSNVLVSALLTRDASSPTVRLVARALERRISAYTSPFQLAELVDVLGRRKFRKAVSLEEAMRFVGFVRDRFRVVEGSYRDLAVVPGDVNDNPIVAIGLEATAAYLITDDAHLLALKVVRLRGSKPLQIVSLEQYDRLETK